MNERGVSLIELLVGVAIVTILLAVAGFQFAGWQRKYNLELEIKSMYSDIQKARADAKASNRIYFFQLDTASPVGGWDHFEDSDNNGVLTIGVDQKREELSRPRMRPDGTFDPPTSFRYLFDGGGGVSQVLINKQGVLTLPANAQRADITIYDPGGSLAKAREDKEYDCIVLTPTRVSLGTWDDSAAPGGCNAQ